jgi:hypothetical protein
LAVLGERLSPVYRYHQPFKIRVNAEDRYPTDGIRNLWLRAYASPGKFNWSKNCSIVGDCDSARAQILIYYDFDSKCSEQIDGDGKLEGEVARGAVSAGNFLLDRRTKREFNFEVQRLADGRFARKGRGHVR